MFSLRKFLFFYFSLYVSRIEVSKKEFEEVSKIV